MASALPKAPTFPSMPMDTDLGSEGVTSSSTVPTEVRPTSMETTTPKKTQVAAVRRSRTGRLLTWHDPKTSGTFFVVLLSIFYFTLYRGEPIVAVLGKIFVFYLVIGLVVVQANKLTGNVLDKYIARPSAPLSSPIISEATVKLVFEELNEFAEFIRDAAYCDNISMTLRCLVVSLAIYVIGSYFSLTSVCFVLTLGAFTLPMAYDKNKSQVDSVVAKAGDVASERALKLREIAINKAGPGMETVSRKLGFTPSKKRS